MSKAWIDHKGGECPVEVGTLVEVKFRNGDTAETAALMWFDQRAEAYPDREFSNTAGVGTRDIAIDWNDDGVDGDIVAYRLMD